MTKSTHEVGFMGTQNKPLKNVTIKLKADEKRFFAYVLQAAQVNPDLVSMVLNGKNEITRQLANELVSMLDPSATFDKLYKDYLANTSKVLDQKTSHPSSRKGAG